MKYLFPILLLVGCAAFQGGNTRVAPYAVQCTNPETDWITPDLDRAKEILEKYKKLGYENCAIILRKNGKIIRGDSVDQKNKLF